MLLQNNSWLDVKPRPGSLVVNFGKTLSESTGGRIKAIKHRVIDPEGERYSLPFFIEPGYFAKVPLSLSLKDGTVREEVPGSSRARRSLLKVGICMLQTVEQSGYYKENKCFDIVTVICGY